MDAKMGTVVSVMAPDSGRRGWLPCMLWCTDNCIGVWRYDTEGVFIFDEARDATAFLLRWNQ